MFAKLHCPDREHLQDLLDGQLPEADQQELTRHLDTCTGCQQALERLAGGDDPWPGRGRPGPRPQLETALRHAMDELKDQTGIPPTRLDGPGEADEALHLLGSPDWTAERERFAPYEVTDVLGRGGMSVVLKAFDPSLNRNVAIKVLAPQLAACAAARRRFAREGKAAAAVSHEHVVAIHAVEPKGSLPYLVMQYVPGVSLQERLDRTGPLELAEILRIGMQVASGLAAAHAQGLVHRDVKPANILLENGLDRVKLTDFGLARAADDASLTQSGVLAGTPQYMAPEQSRGEALDHRADLFSLGSVLYAMCTGRPPFRASTTLAVLRRVSDERPRAIRALNKNIPEWLVRVIDRLHAKDPAQRFQSAAEVAQLLAQCLAHVQAPDTTPLPASLRTPPSCWRRWGPIAALLLAGIGLGVSEAAGMTDVLGALGIVIRVQTPEGTLAIEVDDPSVKVTVQGNDVIITGAGPQEIRLRPGSYTVEGAKEGARPFKDHVTITVNGKQTVKITMEPQAKATDTVRKLEQPAQYFKEFTGRIQSVAFTPDGKLVASADAHNNVWVLDSATGKVVFRVANAQKQIVSLVVFPDGKTLAALHADGTVTLWDVATGKQKATLKLGDQATQGALSPDGRHLATVSGHVRVWDAETGKETLHLGDGQKVMSVRFAPDGKLLATANQQDQVILWDASTGREVRALNHVEGPVRAFAFSPDGRRLAAGDGTVRVWDVQTGRDMEALPGHEGRVGAVAYSPDGLHVASGSFDGTVRIWDAAAPKEVRKFKAHAGPVTCLAFSPDGRRLVSGGDDGRVKFWDVASGRQLAELTTQPTEGQQAESIARQRAVEAEERAAKAEAREAQSREEAERARAEAQQNLYASRIQLAQQEWQAKDLNKARQTLDEVPPAARGWEWRFLQGSDNDHVLGGHVHGVAGITFDPSGKYLASVDRAEVRLWNLGDRKSVGQFSPLSNETDLQAVAYSPDGRQLAVAGRDGTIAILDSATHKRVVGIQAADHNIRALAFSPDGRLVASGGPGDDGLVHFYEAGNRMEPLTPLQLGGRLAGLAFSPDGKHFVTAEEAGTINFWDVESGRLLAKSKGNARVRAVACSPDGRLLAAGQDDGAVALFDVPSGKQVRVLRGPKAAIAAVAFTPDGHRLATAGAEKQIRLWDVATGANVLTLAGHGDAVSCLAFSPDGTILAAGGDDKTIRLWIAPAATKDVPR